MGDRVSDYVKAAAKGKGAPKPKPFFTKKTFQGAPPFSGVSFESEVYNVKMNNAGAWMLTLKVESKYADTIVQLGKATGMNLQTEMTVDGLAG